MCEKRKGVGAGRGGEGDSRLAYPWTMITFCPCRHFQKWALLLNNCEKTKTVLSVVADLMSQEEINLQKRTLPV